MTVKELYEELTRLINRNKGDLNVVIKTSNKSIGRSSSVDIEGVFEGFDWDNGTLFIGSKEDLVLKKLNRDVALDPIDFNSELPFLADPSSNRKVYLCRNCEEKISIKDNYCKNCGQRLK